MKHCPSVACPHRRAVGVPAEYLDAITICSDCGATLDEGSVPESAAMDRPITKELWRRLAVTLLALPVLFALPWVSLPGVDTGAMGEYVARSAGLLGFFGAARAG